jgi:hypothetical protein
MSWDRFVQIVWHLCGTSPGPAGRHGFPASVLTARAGQVSLVTAEKTCRQVRHPRRGGLAEAVHPWREQPR